MAIMTVKLITSPLLSKVKVTTFTCNYFIIFLLFFIYYFLLLFLHSCCSAVLTLMSGNFVLPVGVESLFPYLWLQLFCVKICVHLLGALTP